MNKLSSKEENVFLSVIIPAYNAEKYIQKSILSVIRQEIPKMEIIVVNDGSTDRTAEIVLSLTCEYEYIKLITISNKGVSHARNVGLSLAKGEYITFVDADDYLEKNVYQIMLAEMMKWNADIVEGACRKESVNGSLLCNCSLRKEIVRGDGKCAEHFLKQTNCYNYMCNKITRITSNSHREWFERLESYLDLVPLEKKMILARAIFYCLNKIDSSHIFMGLDARSRALICIEKLLEETEIGAMQKFADEISDKYDKLYMIDQILYWFQNTRSFKTDEIKRRENILKERFSGMCEKVIEEKINIYDDSYYVRYNVWGLIRYLKIKENREDIVRDYIAQIINEENIFRVMGDMISQSIGNMYGYKITNENFGIFFKDESLLDLLLQRVYPKTRSEEFVLKVYEKFKSEETNSWGDKEIVSEVEVLLEL